MAAAVMYDDQEGIVFYDDVLYFERGKWGSSKLGKPIKKYEAVA